MAEPAVQIPVNLDTKAADKDAKRFASNLAQAMSGVRDGLALASAAFRAVGDAVKSVIGPAQEAERAQRALTVALKQQTADYAAHVSRLGAYNKALQESVNIDDDALAALQAKLSLLGVLPSELEAATRATIGLAEITGEDLASAGTKVTKVLAGNIDALAKLGIKGTSIADVLGRLDRGFESATERAKTFEGSVDALGISWEALKEEIGTAIIENAEVKQGIQDLRDWIKDITTTAENGRSKMGDFISTTVSGLRDLVSFVNDHKDAFATILGVYGAAVVGGKLVAAAKVVGAVASSASAIGAAAAGSAAAGVGSSAALALMPLLGLAALPNTRDAIMRSLMPSVGDRPPADAGATYSPAWGPDRNEVSFGVGEGLSVGGDKTAMERARRDAEARARTQREAAKFALDAERESAEAMTAWRESQAEFQLELQVKRDESEASQMRMRLEGVGAALSTERTMWQERNAAISDLTMQGAQMASDGLAATLGGMVAAIASGKSGLDAIVGQMVGGVLTSLGTMLIQMGTAGVLAGTLGTFIPVFAALTGGPLGVGAGLAAIAGGMAMVGIGSALGGAAKPGATASAPRSAAAPSSPRVPQTAAPAGFVRGGEAATNVTNINVSFAGSIATGSPRQIARSLRDLLREGGMMIPAGT